ncbi:3-oxo-5-alpha-steroid 4-dehydrogenase 3 [Schistosoma bovis]|nr:3-oxo-5-alpha-steroid 4-dehydrogenase 3 [Schistosoma bovis]
MLILQYLQDLVFRQLAALRSGKNKNTDKLSEKKYYPPEGSMFYWVSCPHYILEISIYLSCQLFITPKWIPFSHILFFTICNQLCCIWLNHNWYKNNFPEWASKRAMLIPYVW